MKCIRCGTNSPHRARLDRRCQSCAEPFAFEPHRGDLITDCRFDRALSAVSQIGTIRWALDHLYYEVCRRARRHSYFWATRRARERVPFDRGTFDVMWEKWLAAHGSEALPPVPGQGRRIVVEPYAAWLEADITTYAFDRAVICDRGPAVDLLLANDFHVENRCAVLSVDGHPSTAFATVLAMLKSSPSIDVIAVHDASPAGCDLPRRLAGEDQWFRSEILGGRARLVDAGLRPSQTKKLKGCFIENTQPIPEGVYAPKDAKWLQNFNCELAAVRPGWTLRYLRRLLTVPPAPGTRGDWSDVWSVVDGDYGDDFG